jgi:S-adenosylmethionine decarboxylase
LGAPTVGEEWLVDATGCDAAKLRDRALVQSVMTEILRDLDLHVIGAPQWHVFPGEAGVTGLYLLTESHLAVHTYPELGIATFNLYCCRPRTAWPWRERLTARLGASDVIVRSVKR